MFKLYGVTIFPYMYIFLLGSFIAKYRKIILPIIKKYWYYFGFIEAVVLFTRIDYLGRYYIIHTTFLAFFIIGFAYRFPIKIKNDLTYELYLIHGVVFNVFAELGLTGYAYVLPALGISLLIAVSINHAYKSVIKKKL